MILEFWNYLTGETKRQKEMALWKGRIDAKIERARMQADLDIEMRKIEIDFNKAIRRAKREKRASYFRSNRNNRNY